MPLNDSPDERARLLLDIDQKFIVDPAAMNPKASVYFWRRPWLTPDVCRKWRMGYLPRDVGGQDRIPAETSVPSSSPPTGSDLAAVAPEVQSQGFAAADCRSEVYSLCVCLTCLFEGRDDDLSRRAVEVLSRGLAAGPEQRVTLQELDDVLSGLLGDSVPPPAPPPARFWTEEQVVRFRERDYRIVARLVSGGVGTTFKVVEIDRSTKEELGTYVAKVVDQGEIAASQRSGSPRKVNIERAVV